MFINDLKDQYSDFVRIKLNKLQDIKNKDMITEINLNELIDQIITHIINYHSKNKNKNKKVKSLNADSKFNADNKINDDKLKLNSNQVNVNKLKFNDDKEKQLNNNQLNNNNNNINNNQSDSD